MKQLVIGIMLGCLPWGAGATDWVNVGAKGGASLFLDRDSVQRSGEFTLVRSRQTLQPAERISQSYRYKLYNAIESEDVIHCSTGKIAPRSYVISYQGRTVASQHFGEPRFRAIAPGTYGAVIRDLTCPAPAAA